jgi:predicted AAA+ superfamily ATPase
MYNHKKKYVTRIIPLKKVLDRKGVLLLGPRRTGKSAYIDHELKPDLMINLLEADTFRRFSARPELLRELVKPTMKLIIIDEVQKLPMLMDEVHLMIERFNITFLLTGSSAKKLTKNYTHLMAGRLKRMQLKPFTTAEFKKFNFKKAVHTGTIPAFYFSDTPWEDLGDYVGLYLREEIQAEARIRKIENFSRFLEQAACCNTQIINFESVANDAQVPARTIREYYHLLEETLMGYFLTPMQSNGVRKAVSASKFYFFDIGVVNKLLNRKFVSPKSKEFGEIFEHFIMLEIKAYLDYFHSEVSMHYWRTKDGSEIDFIIDEKIGIEIKATKVSSNRDLKNFFRYDHIQPLEKMFLVSLDPFVREVSGVQLWHARKFLHELWNHRILEKE